MLFSLPGLTQAQTSSRAEKLLYKANWYKSRKDTAKAFHAAQLALEKNPAYEDAIKCLGAWYCDAHLYLRAARLFSSAAAISGKSKFALPAANAFLHAGKPDSAITMARFSGFQNEEVKKIITDATIAIRNSIPRDTNRVYKLDQRINTPMAEIFPSLSSDKQTLFFTRRNNGVNEDFYHARPDSCGGWFTARNMGYPPNTAAQESAMTITADDHYLFFMRSDNRSENGWGRGGYDLYLAYRTANDEPWSAAESFGATINTPAYEGMPSLSADITEMYFVSDRPGGRGGLDIWVTRFAYGLWQIPVNLGPVINTAGNETSPFISSDGKTLFFASDGHPGLGGSDIFAARKLNDSSWKDLANLGVPINSGANEFSLYVTPDGSEAYLSSDRDGSADIYYTSVPKDLSPEPTVFAYCRIYDSVSRQPALLGSVTIMDESGNEVAQYHANKGDGSILMSLPMHKNFNYEVRAFNYSPVTGSLRFDSACTQWCTFDYALLPNGYVRPSYDSLLLLLQFAKNVTDLSDSQKVMIQTALAPWKGKADISIFANGFTDNTGTPIINTEKSSIRANNVRAAVMEYGFDPTMISATGFGDASPLLPNDSPEHQDMNRRVELVIRWME
ncbi:MAG: OmpA family protein [Chitinophagaceae bacterium]